MKLRLLTLTLLASIAVTSAIAQPTAGNKKETIYCNPLTLNGRPLDYESFNLMSRGTLALVQSNPESKKATPIPFRIYIRRAGVALAQGPANYDREFISIAIQTVLALARPGDELVIEPVRKSDKTARCVLKLKTVNWFVLAQDRC